LLIFATAVEIRHALVVDLLLFSLPLLKAPLRHQPLASSAASPRVVATGSSTGDVEDPRPLKQLEEATKCASLLSLGQQKQIRNGEAKSIQ